MHLFFSSFARLFTWSLFQAEMFIGLLLRAMKNDVNLKRVAAFSKRLLQVIKILHSPFFNGSFIFGRCLDSLVFVVHN